MLRRKCPVWLDQYKICPFCQQPTDDHFAASLTSFFSEAFDNDIAALKELRVAYQRACDELLSAIRHNVLLGNPFLKTELFNAATQAIDERFKGNQAKLTKKLDEPSRIVEMDSVEPLINQLQKLVDEANQATSFHNETVANIVTEKSTLTGLVWRYVLNELADDLQHYQQNKDRLTRTIEGVSSPNKRATHK